LPCRAELQEEQERQDQLLRETNLTEWCTQMRQKRNVSPTAQSVVVEVAILTNDTWFHGQ